jgi:hypothetical protein
MNKYNSPTSAEHPLWMKIYAELQGNLQNDRIKSLCYLTTLEAAVSRDWLEDFVKWKKEKKVYISSVLINSYDNTAEILNMFSDKVDILSDLKEDSDDIAITIFDSLIEG